MIIKANRHNNGGKLAHYMMNGHDAKRERAELYELKGFGEAATVAEAFRDLEIMGAATRADNALFHVQVRLPEHERLTPEQWEHTAGRIEKRLGLTGQPRAIYFHVNDRTGERHMHVGWSLIDAETMKAKPVPFFKFRLKALARDLENEFNITRVRNEREGPIKYAATKNEQQQAQRLGVDKDAIRNTIRACWDRSDCGRSFDDALAQEGLILAQGTRRDYVVIDHGGGLHALGKRLLDVSAGQVRAKLADLPRDRMPTIPQAREFILDLPRDRADRLARELADVQARIKAEREYARRDPVRDEIQWQEALAKAAIAKEARERQFVEPKDRDRETRAAGREQGTPGHRKERQEERQAEKKWPVTPPQHQSWAGFEKAAAEAVRDDRVENLKGPAAKLWDAFCHSDSAKAYAAALDAQGIMFAAVTKEEAKRSQREAAFVRELGRRAPRFNEGEIVIVTGPRSQYQRNSEIIDPPRIHKLDQSLAAKFIRGLDNGDRLQSIAVTLKASDERALQRATGWRDIRLQNATTGKDHARTAAANIKGGIHKSAAVIGRAASLASPIGKMLDAVGSMVESLAAPKLTPQQIHDGEKAKTRREAEAETTIDFSRVTAETAQQRRQMERDREADRQRDGGGRER